MATMTGDHSAPHWCIYSDMKRYCCKASRCSCWLTLSFDRVPMMMTTTEMMMVVVVVAGILYWVLRLCCFHLVC